VTEEIPETHDLDDARLLNLVRAGDADAFAVLRERHEQAARRLASDLVVSPAEVDDVVAQTFAQVLGVALYGSGPADAFRPYLLTAVRRVCYDRLQGERRQFPIDRQSLADPGQSLFDTAVASPDKSLMAHAFLSLPERWSAVLWHTEIERSSDAEIAPIFGLTRHGVAALRRRAKEGLRQGYLQMHMARVARQACKPTAARLDAFVLNALSKRDSTLVSEHLSECDECQAACAALSDINGALRSEVAPIFLGSAAASYLATEMDSDAAAVTGLTAATAGAMTEAADGEYAIGAGHRRRPRGGGGADGSRGTLGTAGMRDSNVARWLAGAAAAIVAVSGVALAVTLIGSQTPTRSGHQPQAGTTPLPLTLSTPAQPAGSKSAKTRAGHPSISPSQARGSAASPGSASTQPTASSPPRSQEPRGTAQLAASVGVHGGQSGKKAQVAFQVSDAGSAATGKLTVAITLPAGTSMSGGGPNTASDRGDGWTCQPDSTGAICQHGAVQAGSQTGAMIFITIVSTSSACGQPVQLSATDGSVSASAQSGAIPCGRTTSD
jgi:RNA polymerase sigma factor (sigma-70 family)